MIDDDTLLAWLGGLPFPVWPDQLLVAQIMDAAGRATSSVELAATGRLLGFKPVLCSPSGLRFQVPTFSSSSRPGLRRSPTGSRSTRTFRLLQQASLDFYAPVGVFIYLLLLRFLSWPAMRCVWALVSPVALFAVMVPPRTSYTFLPVPASLYV